MIDDRRPEEWPTVDLKRDQEFLPQTPTYMVKMDMLRRVMSDPPPVTPMGQQLGIDDIIRMQQFQNAASPDLYGGYSAPIGVRAGGLPELPPIQVSPPPQPLPKLPPPPPAKFNSKEPSGYSGVLPYITPDKGLGVTLPTSVGDVTAEGNYRPGEWRGLLGFKRKF